jgi:hypothetical protein
MRAKSFCLLLNLVSLAGCLFLADSTRAAVSGINTPGSSFASIAFNDTTSFDPLLTPGVTSGGPGVGPWNGATLTLSPTTDPVTLDYTQGDIDASFIGNTYSIGVNNTTLTQAPLNTGYAELLFQFSVEFQLDAFGLPSQPTLYPNFAVNGTVQTGGFAYVRGLIDYYNNSTLVETVVYSTIFNTPGNFSGIVSGIPVNGITPVMAGNSTLTLTGFFNFTVDPASINVQTVPVPEPASGLLLGAAGLAGLLWRRRFTRPAARS